MSILVGCTIPASSFALGRVLQRGEFIRMDLDRTTGAGNTLERYFWVYGADPAGFRVLLETSNIVDRIDIIDDLAEIFLCRIQLRPEETGLVEVVQTHDAVIIEASGTPERWYGWVRFHTHQGAGRFQQMCHNDRIPLTVTNVHKLTARDIPTTNAGALTPIQREAFILAFERGYFAIPRQATLDTVGEELGISAQAVSERLRRAQTIFARNLVNEDPPGHMQY